MFDPGDIGRTAKRYARQLAARGMTQAEMARALGIRWEGPVSGAIYFVQPEGAPFVKIGFATSLLRRLCSMRTDNHLPLRVLLWFQGSKLSESALHERWKKHRARAEWFRLEGKLELAIAKVRAESAPGDVAEWDEMVGRE
jgi:hypothetical protein